MVMSITGPGETHDYCNYNLRVPASSPKPPKTHVACPRFGHAARSLQTPPGTDARRREEGDLQGSCPAGISGIPHTHSTTSSWNARDLFFLFFWFSFFDVWS